MDDAGFITIQPDEFRQYMNSHNESEYLLIDVRQPGEYTEGHIPGGQLFPLMELESRLFSLPDDKDLIFYCRSGGRSLAAADLASAAEVTDKSIFSLSGGIMAWDGKVLPNFPRVQVFDLSRSLPDLLMTAMNLEKGAWRFYRSVLDRFGDEPIADGFDRLSKAETAHARAVYMFWETGQDSPADFETLYDSLPGDILEGGESLENAVKVLDKLEENPCVDLIELALHIEYAAFDLYRSIAEQTADDTARDAFITIAQAEKKHMRLLTEILPQCGGLHEPG